MLLIKLLGCRITKWSGIARHHISKSAAAPIMLPFFFNRLEVDMADTQSEKKALDEIIRILEESYHVDFSHYRHTTVERRINRRISFCKQKSAREYCSYLTSHPQEIERLYDDLLLSFTEFFREPAVFELLKNKVFPRLVHTRPTRETVRIWVPGCSTGQEVYSLAMCLDEFLEESNAKAPVQIFGTDLVQRHIAIARQGFYAEKLVANIPPERRERFFEKHSGGLTITKHIREMCVFAAQNILNDPPFSRIDLISCRNVLIYFDSTLHETVLPLFHFALNPGGFLLLGSSESMGNFPSLFVPVEKKYNLFTKRNSDCKHSRHLSHSPGVLKPRAGTRILMGTPASRETTKDITTQADRILLDTYAPPGVLVDNNLNIRQFRGATSKYIEPASGEASLKLSRMAREGLMPDLSVAVEEARKTGKRVKKKGVVVKCNDRSYTTDISIIPVSEQDGNDSGFLILFEDSPGSLNGDTTAQPRPDDEEGADETTRLRMELQKAKDHVHTVIEEKDEVNQELWAANEEVLSTNEELQSVNEEMEAAKEELESSNEELLALNEELRLNNRALEENEKFLNDIFESIRDGISVLDPDLNILRVNSWIEKQHGYAAPLAGKKCYAVYQMRTEPCPWCPTLKAFETGEIHSTEVPLLSEESQTGWTNLTAFPMKNDDGLVTGVIEYVRDITDRKLHEKALRETERRYRELFENSRDGYVFVNGEGQIIDANQAYCTMLGYSLEELQQMQNFYQITPKKWRQWEQDEIWTHRLLKNGYSGLYEKEYIRKDGSVFPVELQSYAFFDKNGTPEYLWG
ncbi:MAG: PAS domain S-box protein, partial [Chitinivibrionales bacterium]|nr:PAS domain S-box protein [Chitinivibrionales bacterium]